LQSALHLKNYFQFNSINDRPQQAEDKNQTPVCAAPLMPMDVQEIQHPHAIFFYIRI